MTLRTFTPAVAPSPGTTNSPIIALNEVAFGDGYVQASPKGLNHIRRSLTVKWDVLTQQQASDIEHFLEEHGGYKPFWFAHSSDSVLRKWTCKTWSVTWGHPAKISATFVEDFTLAT